MTDIDRLLGRLPPQSHKRDLICTAIWLLCGDGRISIAIDGGELVIDAPDCVQVATRPEIAQASAEAGERELGTPTFDLADVRVSPCGRCQRLVVDTNQMDLCRGDIERAIAEFLARRREGQFPASDENA
jgi:hypothetical protein